jgi:hypothetical protein
MFSTWWMVRVADCHPNCRMLSSRLSSYFWMKKFAIFLYKGSISKKS